jgi:hypothetical protein
MPMPIPVLCWASLAFMKTAALVFALSMAFSVCASASPPATASDSAAVQSLRWLDSADAQRDLSSALGRGDRRFIGIYGFTRLVPGVDVSLASRYGVRYLRGTSDALESREHARLNSLARNYAERYNKLLLERLKQ